MSARFNQTPSVNTRQPRSGDRFAIASNVTHTPSTCAFGKPVVLQIRMIFGSANASL